MEIYPLEKDGILYGAIQTGEHNFYALENDTQAYLTSIAKFTHLDFGKWSLDEPIYKYYIDPDVVDDTRVKKLTTRLILSHQSGFTNWRGNIADGKLVFEFEPGTKYQYSGEGYEYLRKALEKKFNKSLEELAKELVFEPLNMHDTRFVLDKTMDSARFAKWHNENGELYETEINLTSNAADNLLATVQDYCKFMVSILNGAGISTKLYAEMVEEQVRINDFKYWGLGWWIDENIDINQEFALIHGGDDIGVHTIAFIIPKTNQDLLIFANSDNGTEAYADVLVKFLKKNGEGILNIEMK
jgi:CubicO group peptidase (beta-lactamase class C family)